MKSLGREGAIFGLAVLLAAMSNLAFAAESSDFPDVPAGSKMESSLAQEITAKHISKDENLPVFNLKSGGPSSFSGTRFVDNANPSNTSFSDRAIFAVSLLLALGGVTAIAASWIIRRRFRRFPCSATRGDNAAPPC